MKIAVISDIHENFHNLIQFTEEVKQYKVKRILFLGDFISNRIAMLLANSEIPVNAVWGNKDGDKVTIVKTSLKEGSSLTVSSKTFDTIEFKGRKIFMTHYPETARSAASSGDFDAVFYGHTHVKSKEMVGNCLLLNPGEIAAIKNDSASYAVYDTDNNDAEIFEITDKVSTVSKDDKETIKMLKAQSERKQ